MLTCDLFLLFSSNDTSPPKIYTLSLHDALPILAEKLVAEPFPRARAFHEARDVHKFDRRRHDFFAAAHFAEHLQPGVRHDHQDRKSTRLNSSHPSISYAVFCLKKKNQT